MAKERSFITGVGMTKFVKPTSKVNYPDMGREAITKALLDAHITYNEVQQAVASYFYADSHCGQRVLYQLGMTQIPIYNVDNKCALGSSAIVLARNLVSHGAAGCVLVVGFEKMSIGSLIASFHDRADPLNQIPFAIRMFGDAAREYMQLYGAESDDFAEIARINHAHSRNNPYAQFQDVYTMEEIKSSPKICAPLTKLQCCPTSNGASAAVVVSESFMSSYPQLWPQAAEIIGQSIVTDSPATYNRSAMNAVGYEMVKRAGANALREGSVSITDVKIVELHDCFSSNEMITLDALGLASHGKAHEYMRRGDLIFGSGAAIINPSGGLLSKGHLRGWGNNRYIH